LVIEYLIDDSTPTQSIFDPTTEILDLGNNVAELKRYPYTQYTGNRLKVGYQAIDLNTDYGIENTHTQTEYKIPQQRVIGEIDMSSSQVITNPYAKEKMRAQQLNQSIETPSSSNDTVLMECYDTSTTFEIETPGSTSESPDVRTVEKWQPKVYPLAQNHTSTDTPYVSGLYYPDTFPNLGLRPLQNMYRNGAYTHMLCYKMDTQYLQFVKQYQMQYNNTPLALPGITTFLNDTAHPDTDTIVDVADVLISNLHSPVFIPQVLEFTSRYPVNMYNIFNNTGDANYKGTMGYISGTWNGTAFHGYILDVVQQGGTNAATTFRLLELPS
jgi:hypothetical protein